MEDAVGEVTRTVCLRLCRVVEGGRLLKLIGLLILQFSVECFELEISLLGGCCNWEQHWMRWDCDLELNIDNMNLISQV